MKSFFRLQSPSKEAAHLMEGRNREASECPTTGYTGPLLHNRRLPCICR